MQKILFYQDLIVSARQNLNSLYKYGELSYDDQESIAQLVEVYDALYEQSRTALKYSYTLKETDRGAYHRARKETINKINVLFEIDFE